MLPVKRILCPTDFSEPSKRSLAVAREFASLFGAELFLLHVVPPPTHLSLPEVVLAQDPEAYRRSVVRASTDMLEKMTHTLIPPNIECRTQVAEGPPAETIVQIADEDDVDMIVISTHGHTGWRHLVFGSVAEKVVRLSKHAVLTVRAPLDEGAA